MGVREFHRLRKIDGAHSARVAASLPTCGMISGTVRSRAACTIVIVTRGCALPTRTSAWSSSSRRLTFSAAFAGSDASSRRITANGAPAQPDVVLLQR
jgi:hypothetical protein